METDLGTSQISHSWCHTSTFVKIQLLSLLLGLHFIRYEPPVVRRRAHSQSWAARVMWEHWSVLRLSLRGYYLHVDPLAWAPRLSFSETSRVRVLNPDCLLPSLTWPSLAATGRDRAHTDALFPVCTLCMQRTYLGMGTGHDTTNSQCMKTDLKLHGLHATLTDFT